MFPAFSTQIDTWHGFLLRCSHNIRNIWWYVCDTCSIGDDVSRWRQKPYAPIPRAHVQDPGVFLGVYRMDRMSNRVIFLFLLSSLLFVHADETPEPEMLEPESLGKRVLPLPQKMKPAKLLSSEKYAHVYVFSIVISCKSIILLWNTVLVEMSNCNEMKNKFIAKSHGPFLDRRAISS